MGILLFSSKTTRKCYFMTFTHAETFSKFRRKISIDFFCRKLIIYSKFFYHGFKTTYNNLFFSKFNPFPSLPSVTEEDSIIMCYKINISVQ